VSEESAETKALKQQDDPKVIPARSLHKILVKLLFSRPKVEAPQELTAGQENANPTLVTGKDLTPDSAQDNFSWVFFACLTLRFATVSSREHTAKLILRFGLEASSCTKLEDGGSVSTRFGFEPTARNSEACKT